MSEHEWQVEIRVRRNGRMVQLVECTTEVGPGRALYEASNDLERWCDSLRGDETLAELRAAQP